MSAVTALWVGALLLGFNGVFVAAEFAVVAARRSQIEPLAAAGRRGARTTMWAMEHLSMVLAGAQLGITVCSLGLGAVAEPALAGLLEEVFAAVGLPAAAAHPVAFALALGVVVFAHVVAGELVPKNLALAGPERAAVVLVPPLVALARASSPLVWVLNLAARGLLRPVGVRAGAEVASGYTAQQLHPILEQSFREGLLDDEHRVLTGAIDLSGTCAADVMVPRAALLTLAAGSTPADVEAAVARSGFSRFPVLAPAPGGGPGGGAGERALAGYVHVKDLLYADDGQYLQPVPVERVRVLPAVAAGEGITEVLAAMRHTGTHLARVLDAAGRTLGVVFFEDVLEVLVGEVRDGTRRAQPG